MSAKVKIACPVCGTKVTVNRNGCPRAHRSPTGSYTGLRSYCDRSYQRINDSPEEKR